MPRSLVRPSVAFDREPAGRRRCDGRRPSSSGRGSRAPSRDAASWADRSASSGLCAILSAGPRVDIRPRKAHERAQRPRRARRRVRRPADDMTGSSGVSNARRARRRRRRLPACRADSDAILPGSMPESPCDGRPAGAILTGPSAPGRSRVRPPVTGSGMDPGASSGCAGDPSGVPSSPGSRDPRSAPLAAAEFVLHHHLDRDTIDRMDAKQVWRAALGELQVSLSPANFETWLRDTQLIDVDEQRFRIAVPNGFAKDWLENRYRSLISQTLARIVGYSVQVEFAIVAVGAGRAPARTAPPDPRRPSPQVRLEPGRVGGEGSSRQPQPALHVRELHRRLGQPPRPRREPVGRRAPRPRLQPALPVRRGRPRQDPPDARDRQPGRSPSSRASASSTRRARSSRTSSSPRSSRARSTSSGPATGGSTCS